MVDFLIGLLNILMILGSLFLIGVILIQRGKGGGLAGAFGGVGGSSAFGTKAGDVFTRITIGTVAVWMLMAMLLVVLMNHRAGSTSRMFDEPTADADATARAKARSRTAGKATGAAAPKGTDLLDLPPSPATDVGAGAPPIPAPVDIPAIPGEPTKGTGAGKAAAPAPVSGGSSAPAPAGGKAAATPKSP